MGADVGIRCLEQGPLLGTAKWTNCQGVDVVLEMSGNPTAIQQGFSMLTYGGRMSMLGLPTRPVELNVSDEIVFKGIQIHGIVGRRMYETWQQTAGFLESGRIDLEPMITHRFPLEDYKAAFQQMISG